MKKLQITLISLLMLFAGNGIISAQRQIIKFDSQSSGKQFDGIGIVNGI